MDTKPRKGVGSLEREAGRREGGKEGVSRQMQITGHVLGSWVRGRGGEGRDVCGFQL